MRRTKTFNITYNLITDNQNHFKDTQNISKDQQNLLVDHQDVVPYLCISAASTIISRTFYTTTGTIRTRNLLNEH